VRSLTGRDVDAGALLHGCGDGVALCHCPAGKMDVGEYVRIHRHLVDRNGTDTAGTNHQNPAQRPSPPAKIDLRI